MMRSVAPMKTAKTGYILISIILCVLGILLIAFPKMSSNVLGILCGILLILFGGIKLVGYFSKDLYRLAFQYDLAFGILLILLGIVMLAKPGSLMNFISIVLGLIVLTDGLFKIQIAMDSRRFGLHNWWLILVAAILAGILGLILMLRPTESSTFLTILLGIALLSEGILNLCTVITAVKIIKNQKCEVIDIIE